MDTPTKSLRLLCLLALLPACLAPPVTEGTAPIDACAADSDCPGGYYCAGRASHYCELLPAPCAQDSDCISHHYCAGGGCQPDCTLSPCRADQRCPLATLRCEALSPPDGGSGDAGPACTTDTWKNFASALVTARCNGCHTFDYRAVSTSARASAIHARVSSGNMPPPPQSLGAQDKARLLKWIDCGLPE